MDSLRACKDVDPEFFTICEATWDIQFEELVSKCSTEYGGDPIRYYEIMAMEGYIKRHPDENDENTKDFKERLANIPQSAKDRWNYLAGFISGMISGASKGMVRQGKRGILKNDLQCFGDAMYAGAIKRMSIK